MVGREEKEERVAFITAAASGIGRATADLFQGSGFKGFRAGRGHASAKDRPDDNMPSSGADVGSAEAVRKTVEQCEKAFSRLGVVVNCAGVELHGTTLEIREDEFDRVMQTNVKGVFLVCKHAIPLILRTSRAGSVIKISSDPGIQPFPGVDAYAATKCAMIALTKVMSKNWAKQGLRVNCIAPGPIDTLLSCTDSTPTESWIM